MNYNFNREWLSRKFEEIKFRIIKAIDQLTDEQLNWSPDEVSHNIPTLIRHIEGNIKERINKGIYKQEVNRDRENEFKRTHMSKEEAKSVIGINLQFVIDVLQNISDEELNQLQTVRGKERSNIDMLHQCAAHYSEHMGQILYIAKQCLNGEYKTTSV